MVSSAWNSAGISGGSSLRQRLCVRGRLQGKAEGKVVLAHQRVLRRSPREARRRVRAGASRAAPSAPQATADLWVSEEADRRGSIICMLDCRRPRRATSVNASLHGARHVSSVEVPAASSTTVASAPAPVYRRRRGRLGGCPPVRRSRPRRDTFAAYDRVGPARVIRCTKSRPFDCKCDGVRGPSSPREAPYH